MLDGKDGEPIERREEHGFRLVYVRLKSKIVTHVGPIHKHLGPRGRLGTPGDQRVTVRVDLCVVEVHRPTQVLSVCTVVASGPGKNFDTHRVIIPMYIFVCSL